MLAVVNITRAQTIANPKRAKYSRRRAEAAGTPGPAAVVKVSFSVVMAVLSVVTERAAAIGTSELVLGTSSPTAITSAAAV